MDVRDYLPIIKIRRSGSGELPIRDISWMPSARWLVKLVYPQKCDLRWSNMLAIRSVDTADIDVAFPDLPRLEEHTPHSVQSRFLGRSNLATIVRAD